MSDPHVARHAAAATGVAGVQLHTGLRRGRAYLYEVESLRGIAVLLVFLFHVRGIGYGNEAGAMAMHVAFVAVGNTGVTLFFVLSGFLLSGPWLNSLYGHTAGKPDLRTYAASRALRILPLYYAAIVVAAVDLGEASLLLPAASFQMLGFEYFPHSVVWWTLITEVQFYLVLPVLGALLVSGRIGRWILAVALFIWGALYLGYIAFNSEPVTGFLMTKSLFARLPAFLTGIGVGAIYRSPGFIGIRGRWRAVLLLAALLLLGSLLQAVAAVGENVAEVRWPVYHLWEALCWGMVLLALVGGQPVRWLLPLVNPAFAVLGKLSYSIYLNHVPLLIYLVFPLRGETHSGLEMPAAILLTGVCSLLLASLTYFAIERPFLRLKERLR